MHYFKSKQEGKENVYPSVELAKDLLPRKKIRLLVPWCTRLTNLIPDQSLLMKEVKLIQAKPLQSQSDMGSKIDGFARNYEKWKISHREKCKKKCNCNIMNSVQDLGFYSHRAEKGKEKNQLGVSSKYNKQFL